MHYAEPQQLKLRRKTKKHGPSNTTKKSKACPDLFVKPSTRNPCLAVAGIVSPVSVSILSPWVEPGDHPRPRGSPVPP